MGGKGETSTGMAEQREHHEPSPEAANPLKDSAPQRQSLTLLGCKD